MIHLDQQDLQRLAGILQRFSEFEDEKSRRSFLPLVGLGPLLPRMDLAGTPFIASMKIINFLAAYGCLSNGVEALGSLLDGIRAYLGLAEQHIIDEIATKYQLLSPYIHIDVPTDRAGVINGTGSVADGGHNSPQKITQSAIRARKVLISYCSKDEQWLEMLKTQLALLERQHVIELWDDTRIGPGLHREKAMNEALDGAHAALLLVSANFLASDVIMDWELPRILSRHAQGRMLVLSLILSPCLYQESPLHAYPTFNSVDRPLSRFSPAQADAMLVSLARELQRSIESFC